jgi:ATP phosphoribosyltransferase regulatory subunit
MTSRLPSFAADIRAVFDERDVNLTEIGVLQPADPFLDMAGEDLRRRIFLTESETGEALCLRPEFTIPVCLDHIASQAGTPRRYAYLGEVFRQQRDGSAEFFQAGIEDLGETNIAAADARSVADAHALLTRVLPGKALNTMLGDQRVFEAVLAALGLPRGWRTRLARAFGSAEQLASALHDLANPVRSASFAEPVASLVFDADQEGLAAHIRGRMDASGLPASAGRSPSEIARRLIEKAELRSVRLAPDALEALKTFLAIRTPIEKAAEALASFETSAGVSLGSALELFAARANAIVGHGLPAGSVSYDASFGRPLDYYTGLVFEITAEGSRPLVGGGRYDRLLTLLGASQTIPGVGFSVWLDRIEKLRGDAA